MPTETSSTFTDSLTEVAVDWTRTDTEQFGADLATVATLPIVGSELPYDDLSLPTVDGEAVNCDPSLAELREAQTGITPAAFGIADYGSIVLRTDDLPLTESASLFVDHHVAVLAESDILSSMGAAVAELAPLCCDQQESAIIATGPSATADMGALVRGAHGPKTVHVLLLTDQ